MVVFIREVFILQTKIQVFKYTFLVLGIMCFILIASTSIYGIHVSTNKPDSETWQITSASEEPSEISNASQSNNETENSDSINSEEADPSYETNQISSTTDITYPTITISAVGDLMFHQANLTSAYNPKTSTYDFNGFFEYVKPYLTDSDLTIGNFETITAGPGTGYTSFPAFNTPDSVLTALSSSGFDVLSTANNHCLDRGITGLTRTIQKITDNNMINVGSSIDGKNKYITKDVNGIDVSILAYTYSFNGLDSKLDAKQKSIYLSSINEVQIKSDIAKVKEQGTDAVIVIIHWGNEYQRTPNNSQTSLSKKILSWGADIILGSHPHVLQKSEIVKVDGKDKFIIYSMGNFISGYRRSDKADRQNKIYTEDGVIVKLKLEKDPEVGVLIKQVDYIPTWVDKYYINKMPIFKVIPIPSNNVTGSYITNYNRHFINQSYKNTMEIMAKWNNN